MNKTVLVLVGLLAVGVHCAAQQKGDIAITASEAVVGKTFSTDQPIRAKEYLLPQRIHDFHVDTTTNSLTLFLRDVSKNGKYLENKGHVVRYNADQNQVKWSKKLAYQQESIDSYGGITIHTTAGKSYCLDNETAAQLWEVKNNIAFAGLDGTLGIGYKRELMKGKENSLEGIDLKTGRVAWSREINKDYGWNDLTYLNDSVALIAAAGLHAIHLKTGTGWDYAAVTGKKDYTGAAVATGLGIVTGVLTGAYIVPNGPDVVSGMASNILLDSTAIYFASKEEVARLDLKGNVQWKFPFPADIASKSVLFKDAQNLYMLNRGFAMKGNKRIDLGAPFILSVDLQTGKQKYLTMLSSGKKSSIESFTVASDTLLVMFEDGVAQYSLGTGALAGFKKIDVQKYGNLKYFIGSQVYVKQGETYKSLPDLNPSNYYLYTQTGKTLVLGSDLSLQKEMDSKEFYLYYRRKNDLRFIAKENQTIILDSQGKPMAEVAASRASVLLGKKLYSLNEARFYEVDLSDLLKD